MTKLPINPLPSTTYHLPTTNRGFTIIELIIVISIMGILLTLGVVNLRSSQANGRDAERKVDIEAIAQHLETYYTSGTDASNPSLCTGGTITHDGLYTVHTFTSGGTLTCNTGTIVASVLVVGGGGGGGVSGAGDNRGGGGGAGGVVYTASTTLASGVTTVVVGNGGAYSTAGSISSFGATQANGGGAGGNGSAVGGNGASGGGGSAQGSPGNFAGGTASQGNAGGTGGTDSLTYRRGGGGGGAGNAGVDAFVGGSDGGRGVQYLISGVSTYYAGGGGGGGGNVGSNGNGGLGGGGTGGAGITGTGTPGFDGTPNTGGGGGGSGNNVTTSGAGGSGIVIVRYQTPVTSNTYPSTALTTNVTTMVQMLRDIDTKSLTAPDISDPPTLTPTSTFISATDNTVPTSASLHPTKNEYVYQPIHTDGTLCNDSAECSEFNLYYRNEIDNSVNMVSSIDQ